MNYIRTEDNAYPFTERDIREAHPNTSFATPFAPEGYAVVFPTPKPAHNPVIQWVAEIAPQLKPQGHYEQQWQVRSLFTQWSETVDGVEVVHTVAEQEAAALLADQAIKAAQLQASIVEATQARLDAFAKTRNYDGILSACTYATSTIPKFQTEGQYAVNARDATWARLYEVLSEVQSNSRPMPTGFQDIEAELPALAWPA